MSAVTLTDPVGAGGLPPRPLTVADLAGLPDDGHRYELLDGVLLVSPAPRVLHQKVLLRLWQELEAVAPAEFELLCAPFAVHPQGRLSPGEQGTELQPDLVVAPADDFSEIDLPVAPTLAVEVLSPSTRLMDLTVKRAAYERMGTPSFWVVDPGLDGPVRVQVFELDGDVEPAVYRLVADVSGSDELVVTRPFPVRLRPADLVTRRPGDPPTASNP